MSTKSKKHNKSSKKQNQQNKQLPPQQIEESWIKQQGNNVMIELNVKPNSKQPTIFGLEDDLLKIGIDAPPVDGKANTEVILYIGSCLNIKKSKISIIKGQTSHHKTLLIEDVKKEDIKELLEKCSKHQ
ncbi:Uncharacterized protein QTN25_003591 [Entamoeba marina]